MKGIDWRGLGLFFLGFLTTPFLTTGLYRVLPNVMPLWPVPLLVLAVAAGIFRFRRDLWKLSVGMTTAAILHALLLAFLIWELAQNPLP